VHAFVVAGSHSGAGKTSVTLGLTAALRRRGLAVQPFKVGPDFIDPAHHTRAAGRPSHNLDGWMLSRESNLELFAAHTADADVAIVEGMMGLFDGADPRSDAGSAAEIAQWLGAPVVLVIDASAMARSAAALVHGYATFEPRLRVAGVVANRVGSEGHAGLVRTALEDLPPLLGWLAGDPEVAIPERHLGLSMPEPATDARIARLGDAVERSFDLDALLAATEMPAPAPATPPAPVAGPAAARGERVRIGVARDDAFGFYYEDNLLLLAEAGAQLVPFSPLHGELPAALDGVYLGGGYPELHAAALAANRPMLDAIRAHAAAGRPVYGECGGLMYLGESLRVDGREFEMAGVLPLRTEFPGRLEIGYCEVEAAGPPFGELQARGHWFHKGRVAAASDDIARIYSVRRPRGEPFAEGYSAGSALASWVHLHFRSNPEIPRRLVGACAAAAA
jgi:cobyrinic acid a,c-diamide synthase